MKDNHQSSRRKFIQQTTMAGAGLMLANPLQLFSQTNHSHAMDTNIKSKGYAGKDEHGKLVPWLFERRTVGDNDVLIDIKYSSICHSDIHTIRGHWGKQSYPRCLVMRLRV
ncbi:MAG: alcohol dehydrogenase catalytic domain-containing protein [Chitinophagaceae bacterium]